MLMFIVASMEAAGRLDNYNIPNLVVVSQSLSRFALKSAKLTLKKLQNI